MNVTNWYEYSKPLSSSASSSTFCGGSPRRARMFRMPRARASSRYRSISGRGVLMHVRWAIAVAPCSRWMRSAMSRVRSRVLPPAP